MRCAKRQTTALVIFLLISSLVQSSDTPTLIYKKKYVMGTVFEIVVYARPSHDVSEAIQKVIDEITRIDDLMSNYKADSALSKLNRSAHFHTQTVPPDLYRAIDRSVRLSKLSGVPTPAQQQEVRDCVGYEKIELTPPDQITFHSNCLQVDLGAIGKGYAVDRAAEILKSFGIRNALINAGAAWLVHLRDPSRKIDPQVMLKDQSVSTSEQSAPSLLSTSSAGHIVDPETGKPLKTEFAVSVIAKRGIITDGLSTTLLLLGPTKGKLLVREISEVSAIWISPAAQIETAIGGPQIIFAKKSL
jgi:thiamine biosynthesis lipoprotein ApbE